MAGGQGATDIAALLIEHGAPKDSTNVNGKGAVQLGFDCSRTTGTIMRNMGAIETRSQRSGRTRKSDAAPSRQIRRAKRTGFAMAQRDAMAQRKAYQDPRDGFRRERDGFRLRRR